MQSEDKYGFIDVIYWKFHFYQRSLTLKALHRRRRITFISLECTEEANDGLNDYNLSALGNLSMSYNLESSLILEFVADFFCGADVTAVCAVVNRHSLWSAHSIKDRRWSV